MLTVLWDRHGPLMLNFMPQSATINADRAGASSLAASGKEEFYPYCIEDADKSTPEKIVLRINLENEEAENFKNRYSVVSNTNWIVYGCTPNPQR
ncbi:hypothetical protein TNCV_3690461 [Trichonephila clavipes]|uniref:Uncharacterized protein n=1 Tax=Trichonephila clavipes TaxID=2585209 RepID=A0A8X6VQ15_TRICX|nr:hypothetical protein TNCV_3690461 [Trichonephila clavipes]